MRKTEKPKITCLFYADDGLILTKKKKNKKKKQRDSRNRKKYKNYGRDRRKVWPPTKLTKKAYASYLILRKNA